MKKFFTALRGSLVLFLLIVAILFSALYALILAPFVFVVPAKRWRHAGKKLLLNSPLWWMDLNRMIMRLSTHGKWDIQGEGDLDPNKWYLLISNHRSWLDILVLGFVFNRKIPVLKFFMKKELLWSLPLAGIVCYILGYPFMARHTPSEIRKNPALKTKDIETTRAACEKFKELPTTVMNFVEGTRFTEAKHQSQSSPYFELLKPKAAGIAIVTQALADILSGIVNVTVYYEAEKLSLWQFACGNFDKMIVRYELLPITPELVGDFYQDRAFRKKFQAWLNQVWEKKAEALQEIVKK